MTREDFIALRDRLGLTQTAMGHRMGLSLRAVQDVEGGVSKLSARHVLLAERVALSVAVETGDPMKAPAGIRREALDLARLIRGE